MTTNFTQTYYELFDRFVYTEECIIVDPRGMESREQLFQSFTITDPLDRLPRIPGRKFSMSYCVAEWLWYLSGDNSVEWISRYSPFWKGVSDDGVTANSAYGYRLFRVDPDLGESQWQRVVRVLKKDINSRRAILHFKGKVDNDLDSKDIPCTLSMHFIVREGKLNAMVHMRSSDLIFGIALDIPAFTLLQEMMARELGVGVGTYYHVSDSLHVYSRHYEMVSVVSQELESGCVANCESLRMRPLPAGFSFEIVNEMKQAADIIYESDAYNAVAVEMAFRTANDPYYADWVTVLALKKIRPAAKTDGALKLIESDLIAKLQPAFRWYYQS